MRDEVVAVREGNDKPLSRAMGMHRISLLRMRMVINRALTTATIALILSIV